MNLQCEINSIEITMKSILSDLDIINDDNFANTMESIKLKIEEIEKVKVAMKKKCPENIEKIYSDAIHRHSKQIFYKFDDIIGSKKSEQNKISAELNNLTNKKKLIKYER